jgi:hypothetical protein
MDEELLDLRIGDLIDVPAVQTVIDLSEARDLDPDDPENRVHLEALSHDFVLTDDIQNIFTVVMNHLEQDEGRGFFVVGNYGTGKSHLLSVLGLIARYSWAQKAVFHQQISPDGLHKALRNKRLLPVMIPLTEYASELKLETIFWHSAENAATAAGIPLALSYTQLYITFFNRYILGVHETEFRDFIKTRFDMVSWEQICRDDPASAHTIIQQFLETSSLKIAFDPAVDRKALFVELLVTIRANGWGGILFLIDELSEFLQSKPAVHQLHEDTRFLQFLGEASSGHPIWIVAAIQEALDMNRNIARSVFNKIKARYVQLNLSTGHLQQFISERLLRKKHRHATSLIGKIFDDLSAAFKHLPVTKTAFTQLYPVHPDTLKLLDQNIDLFSRHRGLVDFLSTRIRGKPESLIDGILDEPCHRLLTPDVIFDHFQAQLGDSARYSILLHVFTSTLLPRVKHRFTDENEYGTAVKTMKILFLLAISPVKEQRTVKDLANMVLYRVFETPVDAGDTNYVFFEERIMRILFQHVGYMTRISGTTRLDDRYQLTLDMNPVLTIEERIERLKGSLSPEHTETYDELIRSMGYGLFPLATVYRNTSIRDSVLWQNTRRRIAVRLIDTNELQSDALDTIRTSLLNGIIDFALILIFPGDIDDRKFHVQKFLTREPPETVDGWAFILPVFESSTECENVMLDIQACRVVEEELSGRSGDDNASDILEILKDRRDRSISAGTDYLRKAYMSGWFILNKGTSRLAEKHPVDHFDKWLDTILQQGLTNRYPDHYNVAPGMDCHSKIIQELLLDKFIRPGNSAGLNPAKDAVVLNAIEKTAVPLGLAQKKSGTYLLTGSPTRSHATRSIIAQLLLSSTIDASGEQPNPLRPAGRILLNVIKPPLGMSRPVFDLALITLIRKGYVTAYKSGKKLSVHDLHLPLTGQIDKIRRGTLIAEMYRPAFFLLYKLLFNRHLAELDLDSQDLVWKKLVSQIDAWQETARQFNQAVTVWKNDQTARKIDLKETLGMLNRLDEIIAAIDSSCDDPLQRWHLFLSKFETIEKPDLIFSGLKKLKSFLETDFTAFTFAETYLSELQSKIPNDPRYDAILSLFNPLIQKAYLSDDMVLGDGMKSFLIEFEGLRNLYQQYYCAEHVNAYAAFTNNPHDAVIQSQHFRIFDRLNSITFIGELQENRELMKTIHQMQCIRCDNNPGSILKVHPVCSCGFTLGQKIAVSSPDTLDKLLSHHIYHGYTILCSQIFLTELAVSGNDILDKSIVTIDKILSLDPKNPTFLDSLDRFLDDDTISYINHLHSALKPAVVISCKDLISRFKGCTLSTDQARKKLQDIMTILGQYDDGEWIRFDE